MKYQIGQVVKFNSVHHKNLQGKITKTGSHSNYGNYYVVEADAILHPEVEIKNIWIYEKSIIGLINKITPKLGSSCEKCNMFNEYINIIDYVCYSCRSGN